MLQGIVKRKEAGLGRTEPQHRSNCIHKSEVRQEGNTLPKSDMKDFPLLTQLCVRAGSVNNKDFWKKLRNFPALAGPNAVNIYLIMCTTATIFIWQFSAGYVIRSAVTSTTFQVSDPSAWCNTSQDARIGLLTGRPTDR